MANEWIVRVQGKEYGPVDLDELRLWKEEGRLIRENEIRVAGRENWIRAGELPELFPEPLSVPPALPTVVVRPASLGALLRQTWQIFRQGFWAFFALSALVFVPSLCTQLSSAAIGPASDMNLDLGTALAGLFNLCMLVATLMAWPLYVAGIQIITRELAQGRSITWREAVARAMKFWPRVAGLCILVYGAFCLLLVLAFGILLMLATATASALVILIALGLLVFQVWMFGRVFAITLFWQETAVLENADVLIALQRSNALVRSRRELPWFRRPLWKGAILASIWCAFVAALTIGPEWTTLTQYFNTLVALQDPQAILQAMNAHPAPGGLRSLSLCVGVVQAVLRPLLGISFVLLYLDITADAPGR